ncbi:MAG: HD domain-containing protein [Deltaproteobacteria bacterium]|nr:HD domain-containing protein [Deltaproteobacteria bacterium]
MNPQNSATFDLRFITDPEDVLEEIRTIVSRMGGPFEVDLFEGMYRETVRLFRGECPGYRACNTKYHNLEHTVSVVLATARLMHGCSLHAQMFQPRNVLLSLVAALLHDVGLIQSEDDTEGTGAKYTVGHEERSVVFLERHLPERGFSYLEIADCASFIRCTILSLPPSAISFSSPECEVIGKIVGTADLLAQMADRCYLEKLLLLFREFEEACLPGFDSELTLLKKTIDFYRNVTRTRLNKQLGGVHAHMAAHFRNRWGVDRDLYAESISKNMDYLKSLTIHCEESITCYLKNLRRGGIAREFLDSACNGENERA